MDSDEDSNERRILLRYGPQADETQSSDEQSQYNTITSPAITNSSNISKEDDDDDESIATSSAVESISDTLADKYEAALDSTGFGPFSIYLLLFCGITLMADTTEILCVSFVMPSAEKDLCLSDWEKGLIGSVIFMGMLFGGYTWGALADQFGRKSCLFFSITMNGIFGLLSAFVEHSLTFGIFRFLSGVGVGASLPVVFSYYSEFLTKKVRGRLISWLSVFWMCGQITTSIFALAVIPRDINIQFGNYTIHSWRLFVCLCTIPAFTSSVMSLLMPESPRYLLVKGKRVKSLRVLKLMYRINKFYVKNLTYPDAITSLFSDDLIVPHNQSNNVIYLTRLTLHKIRLVAITTLHLFSRKLFLRTIIMLLVVFMMSFSTYGITLWFPEYVKKLQLASQQSCVNVSDTNGYYSNFKFHDCTIEPTSIVNLSFYGCSLQNVRLKNANLSQLTMVNVSISGTEFYNIKSNGINLEDSNLKATTWTAVTVTNLFLSHVHSEKLIIKNSHISSGSILFSVMNRLDLDTTKISDLHINYSKLYNIELDVANNYNSTITNSTLTYSVDPCPIVFYEDFNPTKLFLESLYFATANLPGNLLTVLIIDYVPRKWIMSVVLILSGVSVFTLWRVPSETVSVILLCIFNGINVISWNVFNVITAEIYPTVIRSTASGFLSAINRIGAIAGVNLFAFFIDITPAIPILIVAGMLGTSGLLSLLLPRVEKESLK